MIAAGKYSSTYWARETTADCIVRESTIKASLIAGWAHLPSGLFGSSTPYFVVRISIILPKPALIFIICSSIFIFAARSVYLGVIFKAPSKVYPCILCTLYLVAVFLATRKLNWSHKIYCISILLGTTSTLFAWDSVATINAARYRRDISIQLKQFDQR